MTPKEEMQQIIKQCMKKGTFEDVKDALQIYRNTFGNDDFVFECTTNTAYSACMPLISLICLDTDEESLTDFLQLQKYPNLEIAKMNKDDSWNDISDYIQSTGSEYICFFEKNHLYHTDKIPALLNCFQEFPGLDVAISKRNFIDSAGTVIVHPDVHYKKTLLDNVFNGKAFLEYCIHQNINLYGNLSTVMVSARYAQSVNWTIPAYVSEQVNRISFLYQFLGSGRLAFTAEPYVSTILQPYADTADIEKIYGDFVKSFAEQNDISLSDNRNENQNTRSPIKKEITFFYTDKGEYYNVKPVADEAEKRGYLTKFTENMEEPAEIGVYCQHVCYPENSKFSLILLHDMAQGHNRWPNIWEIENWNKFDIGIVPGQFWADLWSQCACHPYTNPRYGTFELGYPKSDILDSVSLKERSGELRVNLNLKYDISVLYAPSWENDEKEDDFIRALVSLPVNLLIKQAHWPQAYTHIINNIEQMRKLHEGKYDNVYYIEPEESIMTALELCDIVVSDESSVMTEALLFGKPSVAVTDWLIPDTIPSRFASVPFPYVIKCKKVELREYIEKFLQNDTIYESVLLKGSKIFSNQGNCCSDILNAIQYYVEGTSNDKFLSKKLSGRYAPITMWN